ncbi:hypothetical protein [Aequorivita xiaoshiensis]|uniref:Lipoprotein n=1 Tax=Aequorivita xiaoshiensis TaxID=2874476 RepID=A0A9X1R0I8_9FLAO|nr:hypothetical protein [Aequorivita xiaoshiensis]MCG2429692.1 hypothetical protein [Aequorivita xiaoshiensis]
MKKIILLLLITLVACSKQDSISDKELATEVEIVNNIDYYDKAYIEEASLSEQLEYKRYHLKKVANWLMKNKSDLYEVISTELKINNNSKRFLVSDIVQEMVLRKSGNIWNNVDLNFSLTAFENLDNDSAYPTVFFPNTSKYTDENRSPYDDSKQLYAIKDYDEVNEKEIMVGYQENANNELEEINEPVVPSIAEESEIIVLNIGPCTGTDPIGELRGLGCNSGGGGGGGGQGLDRHYIRNMTVRENKEPWPERSDVTLVGFKTLGLPYDNGPCGYSITGASDCLNEPEGRYIQEFKRKWIRNENQQTINHVIDAYPNPNNVDMYFALVIFERDNWPASKRTVGIDFPNGVTRTAQFRSWDSEYNKVLVKNKSASQGVSKIDGYSVDNSTIRYNLGD